MHNGRKVGYIGENGRIGPGLYIVIFSIILLSMKQKVSLDNPAKVRPTSLIPKSGQVGLTIQVTADMNISAFAARQKVSGFVCDRVSYLMGGSEPVLVVLDDLFWRVPVIFTLPGQGPLGEVGYIDVNINNGQLMVTDQLILELQQRAEMFAASVTP